MQGRCLAYPQTFKRFEKRVKIMEKTKEYEFGAEKFELECKYNSHKSFYKKAVVFRDDYQNMRLYSYGTHVCGLYKGIPYCNGWYSPTTARHIREFMLQFCPCFDTSLKNLRSGNNGYSDLLDLLERKGA